MSGARPSFGANRNVRLAERAATVMSPINAIEAPAPAATPFSATTSGTGSVLHAIATGLNSPRNRPAMNWPIDWPRAGTPSGSVRSAPAQNPRPAPVSSTARVSRSRWIASAQSRRSRSRPSDRLLSLVGRFRTTFSTSPARSHTRLSNFIALSSSAGSFVQSSERYDRMNRQHGRITCATARVRFA